VFDSEVVAVHGDISLEEIDVNWFRGIRRVGVTSGASTPSQLTRRVIEYLQELEAPT